MISAMMNIHIDFFIQIHEYPSTQILAAALVSSSIDFFRILRPDIRY